MHQVDEQTLIFAAREGDAEAFSALIEGYRREIVLYCYRLLGSLHDAEDLTQDAFLRAWLKLGTFEGRGSFRAWLYRLVTHLGFEMIEQRQRRTLPQLVAAQASGAEQTPEATAFAWLEPLPDMLLVDETSDPERRYLQRESVTLAFLLVLQSLPPQQRAILLLRDVLEWRAREVADLLEMSVAAVESALHRARAVLEKRYHPLGSETRPASAVDEATQSTLARYIQAWEAANVGELVAMLRADATLSMPPAPTWYQGHAEIAAFFAPLLQGFTWKLIPVEANAQPAYLSYRLEPDGGYHAVGLSILTLEGAQVSAITTFLDPTLWQAFSMPELLPST